MSLTNSDIAELVAFRHDLHRHPDLSGEEADTARRVCDALSSNPPDHLITDLGGHGIAAIYEGMSAGPTLLFRCELDALPIHETGTPAYRSTFPGKGHLCGHDGHMAILTGLARLLSRRRPQSGKIILLFQPAEETGAGAAAVIADSRFSQISPDYAFALHNLPGTPLGQCALKAGPVTCASRGLHVTLTGKPAHASQPETGVSPMLALSEVMPKLSALSQGSTSDPDFTLVTLTHVNMGEPAFGIAPGDATLFATLRTLTDDRMDALCEAALDLLRNTAQRHGLQVTHTYRDVFLHTENNPEATDIIANALDALNIPCTSEGLPWRPSEDFGRFGHTAKAALLFLGAGTDHPALHHPDYDFPDDLIPTGVRIFERIARDMLG